MQRKSLVNAECPVARGVERVGEWWSILIMRDALQGLRRFDEFSQSLGIAPNMLTRRLNALVEAGLLEKRAYNAKPLRYEYIPTERGRDLKAVLFALIAWGNKHFAGDAPSVQVVERTRRSISPDCNAVKRSFAVSGVYLTLLASPNTAAARPRHTSTSMPEYLPLASA